MKREGCARITLPMKIVDQPRDFRAIRAEQFRARVVNAQHGGADLRRIHIRNFGGNVGVLGQHLAHPLVHFDVEIGALTVGPR